MTELVICIDDFTYGGDDKVVRFLIEQQNLTQQDLIPQFGSESSISMFMTGQLNLTVEQVRKLSARFKLPANVFIASASVAHGPTRHPRRRAHVPGNVDRCWWKRIDDWLSDGLNPTA